MLYDDQFGKTLVSQDFNSMCADCNVQATISPYPNPGDFNRSTRLVKFASFNSNLVRVTQQNQKHTVHFIPAKGELIIMPQTDERLPLVEVVKEEK